MYKHAEKFRILTVIVLAVPACGLFAWDAFAAARMMVSQQERIFHPNQMEIVRGETVQVENDDGELIHHAYVDSKTFSFDSGDQEPGTTTNIVFSVPGNFVVLCGIHPKMRLDVEVK